MMGQTKLWSGRRFAISLLPCALIGLVWLWSGWYEIGIPPRKPGPWLCTLRAGTVRVQTATFDYESLGPIEFPPHFWERVWRPAPPPALGLARRAAFGLEWTWPLTESAVSGWAFWETIQVPLWLVFIGGAAWPAWKLRRALPHRSETRRGSGSVQALGASLGARYRIGALLRWSGIVACGLLLAVWAGSIWHGIWLNSGDGWMLELTDSAIRLEVDRSRHDAWFSSAGYVFIGRNPHGRFLLRFVPHTWDIQGPRGHTLRGGGTLPLWYLLVPIAVLTGRSVWRHRRRPLPGHCEQCRYDLTGNVSGVCPECGTPCGPAPPTHAQ